VFLFGFAIYPNLLLSSLNPAWSLTLRNAASSHKTLGLMGAVALIGMPFVIAYTIVIYRVFRGKVDKDKLAY
jgi:cytochrome d ubiquinol oxidase subunit II